MTPVAPHPPLREFYGEAAGRETFVRTIFDDTAPWYDSAIGLLSFGSGDWYRRQALLRAGYAKGQQVLDIATGTGVVARAAVEISGEPDAVIGLDPSIGMLEAGRRRMAYPQVQGTSERLPFEDERFDLITIGFAMRHFADLQLVFEECRRVLRPGGKLLILEITAPEPGIRRALLGAYMGGLVPALVAIRSFSFEAARLMRYYWATTRDCVRPDVILDAMTRAGLQQASRHVEIGIFSEYSAVRS